MHFMNVLKKNAGWCVFLSLRHSLLLLNLLLTLSKLISLSRLNYTESEQKFYLPNAIATFSYSLYSQFQSLVKGKRIEWTLVERTLQSMGKDGVIDVEVLAEELAYNKHLQQYRMFIVNRPMVSGWYHRRNSKGGKAGSKEDLIMVRRSHSDHFRLLQCFENHMQVSEQK